MSTAGGASWLRSAAVGVLVLTGIVVVVVFDPLGAIVTSSWLPGLPDLPDLPGWVRWVWRGLMISAVALAVVGALAKVRESDPDEPDDRQRPE